MINVPENLYFIFDLIVAIIFLFNIVKAFKNGFIYELVSLLCLILSLWASWFLSPILAKNVSLLALKELDNEFIDFSSIKIMVNTIVWFIILFIVINLIITIIKPLFKFFTKIPLIGSVNKILGILIGLIEATIMTLLLSVLLTTPLFKNGSDIKENTCLTYVSSISNQISEFACKAIFENIIKDSDIDVDEQRNLLENWLIEQGIFNE